MKNIFSDTRILDQNLRDKYFISDDVMMENAAIALQTELEAFIKKSSINKGVLILCGGGDNGGDGLVLARRMQGLVEQRVCMLKEAKSASCVRQLQRAKACGVKIFNSDFEQALNLAKESSVIIDCIFGSGFTGTLNKDFADFFEQLNSIIKENSIFVVACDIPSAMELRADVTVTMGALKTALFSDKAKDICSKIVCAPLGLSAGFFEDCAALAPEAVLLEKSDLLLPERRLQNVHKGSFGHTAVISGEKPGAAIIASCAAVAFGSGLCTIVGKKELALSSQILAYGVMSSDEVPGGTTAVAVGMGLGRGSLKHGELFAYLLNHPKIPAVLDADILYCPRIKQLLDERPSGIVLTPHPKEAAALFEILGIGTYSVEEICNKRLELAKRFAELYPKAVLVIKGAYSVIASGGGVFFAGEGCAALAKGGSGDVLSGLICALLAQGYTNLEAAKNAVLAHGIASKNLESNSYALSPFALIRAIETIGF